MLFALATWTRSYSFPVSLTSFVVHLLLNHGRLTPFLDQILHVKMAMKEELVDLEVEDQDAWALEALQRDGYLSSG